MMCLPAVRQRTYSQIPLHPVLIQFSFLPTFTLQNVWGTFAPSICEDQSFQSLSSDVRRGSHSRWNMLGSPRLLTVCVCGVALRCWSWRVGYVGLQSKSPQRAPAWYADCSEPKATWASGSRETSAPSPLIKRIWIRGLAHKGLSEVTSLDPLIRQSKVLFTKGLFFLSSCSDLWSPQGTLPPPRMSYLPQSPFLSFILCRVWGSLTISCVQGSHTYIRGLSGENIEPLSV